MVSSRTLPGIPSVGILRAVLACLKQPKNKPFRIWHARRNKEMLLGLMIKHLLRGRIRLVMTSCALRRHSWFPRQLLASMDAIIATSDEAASYVSHVVATIPHGVDCDRFQPAKDRKAALKALGIPGNYGISMVGRIRPEKGSDLFVDAMIRLLPKHPALHGMHCRQSHSGARTVFSAAEVKNRKGRTDRSFCLAGRSCLRTNATFSFGHVALCRSSEI